MTTVLSRFEIHYKLSGEYGHTYRKFSFFNDGFLSESETEYAYFSRKLARFFVEIVFAGINVLFALILFKSDFEIFSVENGNFKVFVLFEKVGIAESRARALVSIYIWVCKGFYRRVRVERKSA